MLKRTAFIASLSILTACSASAGTLTPIEQGTSACIDYLSAGRSADDIDRLLASSDWQEKNRRDSDSLFIRSFKKDDVKLTYKRERSEKIKKLLTKETMKIPNEFVTCSVSLVAPNEEKALSLVEISNSAVRLPKVDRGRYSGSVEGRQIEGVIGYGPNLDGRFLVMASFSPTQ